MDLKDDEKSRKRCEHSHNSRYYEINAGQIFAKNVNAFDTVGGNAGVVRESLPNQRNNEEFINIFDNKPNQETNKMSSKVLVNEMLKNYGQSNSYNEHHLKEQYDAYQEGNLKARAEPMVSKSANTFNTKYSFCSRDVYKTRRDDDELKLDDYNQDNNRHKETPSNEMVSDHIIEDGNEQCDKNTHSCPLHNMYNQDYVYRIMHRNAKLQKIVRKLVIEREREKQREAWNNYINDLKNKHGYYSNEPSRISPQYVPGDHNTPEMIDDFYNMRLNWRHQSNTCKNLLENIYGANDYSPTITHIRYPHNYDSSIPPDVGSFIYDNDRFCYPTCSQANMLRLNKERQGYAYNYRTKPSGRYFHGNGVVVDNNRAYGIDNIQGTARPYFPVPPHTRKPRAPASIQTANLPLVNEEDYKELNVPKAEIVQDANNIYFPYCTDAKTSAQEESLDRSQYLIVPLKHKSFKHHVHAGVPFTQEASKLDKDVNIPSKHESLRNNKDSNETNKQTAKENKQQIDTTQTHNSKLIALENKIDEKIYNIQKPLKNDVGNNVDLQKSESFKENFKKITDNITKLKAKIRQSEEDKKIKSLATIEEKIDCLMKSMNSIMIDIQARRNTLLTKRSSAVSACKIVTTSRTMLNRHNSDPHSYKNEDYVVQYSNSSRSLMISEIVPNELWKHGDSSISKMEKIFLEEIQKSDKAKSDIEEILKLNNDRSCSLQITFEVPTKDRSTEVTDSLSTARNKPDKKPLFEKRPPSDHRAMTIAVNTDPLGLLALLRVSAETVKRMLSYVPNLNYQNYLSLLPLLLPAKRCAPHYTCNVCGASFGRPSQLTSHVRQHNLGRTRDCCVCRHALDLKSARSALFSCRYCGQRFTRAYCCELHQRSCARHLGRPHDVTSSHMLLQ